MLVRAQKGTLRSRTGKGKKVSQCRGLGEPVPPSQAIAWGWRGPDLFGKKNKEKRREKTDAIPPKGWVVGAKRHGDG